jgi:hypothetical protein
VRELEDLKSGNLGGRVTSTESNAGRTIAFFSLLLAAAFVVRLAVVLSLGEAEPWFDAKEYHRLAVGLSETWSYRNAEGEPTAYWPPGYPFFLALVYSIFGPSLVAVRVVQSAVGTITCAVIFLIASRLIDKRAAMLALALAAVYPLTVYTAGTLYPAALQTFLVACVIYLCLVAKGSSSAAATLAAGLTAGCAVLVAPSALPAALLAAVWLVWWGGGGREAVGDIGPKESQSAGKARSRVPAGRLVPAILFLIPMLVVIGFWSARNYRVLGKPVAVSANGGFNFWLGNHPEVTATTGNRMNAAMRRELGAIYAQHRNEADRDRALYATTRDYIAADPGRFVRLSIAKAVNLWRLYPRPATEVRPAAGREKLLSLLSYGVLLPFGVFWLFRSLKDSAGARLILLVFIGYTFMHAFFISKVRFRVPLDPYVIVYASAALLALLDFAKGRIGRSV